MTGNLFFGRVRGDVVLRQPYKDDAHMTTTMVLTLIGNILAIVLFLYLLYVVGGISRNSKKILQKLDEMEKRLK